MALPNAEAIKLVQQYYQDNFLIVNCGNCDHCNHVESTCMLYNAKPPIDVIVKGCERWTPDIPF